MLNGYVGGYGGGEAALNGNLLSRGVIFRLDGNGGQYESRLISASQPQIEVPTGGGDVLVGYRMSLGASWLTGFVGGDVQAHDNPDPGATLRGTEGGVKGLAEYFGPLSPKLDLLAYGSYSTAFSTYQAFARFGYKIHNNPNVYDVIKIGPEVSSFGIEDAYRDGSIGGFIGFENAFGQFAISGGYRHPFTDSPDGYYGNMHFGMSFY